MVTFLGSHRLLRGAFVGLDPFNLDINILLFRDNPDTLK